MRVAGIDIGSRSIEVALLDNALLEKGGSPQLLRADTTFDALGQSRKLLDGLDYDLLVATGYGRKLVAERIPARVITEIQAHALGARHHFPDCRAVLDIGGQDTKALSLGEDGGVTKFEMNDRCAAGTGKFLEFMAASLQIPLEQFGDFALEGQPGLEINSMCTVFAETEATSLMAQGKQPESIALGLHKAIIKRTVNMLNRVGLNQPLVFTGGVANNPCVLSLLASAIKAEEGTGLLIPENPDMVGALGAALHATDS